MLDFTNSIGEYLKNRLKQYETKAAVYEYGVVKSSADEIVHINGLGASAYGELLEFENGIYGIALDLGFDDVGAVLLNSGVTVSTGSIVKGTGKVVEVPVGDHLLGRIVDPIGRPMDGEPLTVNEYRPIENPAPSIIDRAKVDTPLETGILAIDSMIPIGKGQRELIIGDRQTGKTSIAIDTILNQKGKDVICVYTAIGQKASNITQIVRTLERHDALQNTVVVASTANDCAAMQYIVPYSGCAIAEYFMYSGKDVLIVYDDLSKHAVAYRAMSLLLHRPPGREAYPGDVFYLHSRLLERAAKLSPRLGGGSMTALPIVETMAGDISAYIPTNVISITDGQIFLESELFNSGVRPAINVGLSVSRVGRSAQHKAMKKVSGGLRLDLAQYREMAVFAQFGSDIDDSTKKLLTKGERLTETLKQAQSANLSLPEQIVLLLAYSEEIFIDLPLYKVGDYKSKLLRHLWSTEITSMTHIATTGDLTDKHRETLIKAMKEYIQKVKE